LKNFAVDTHNSQCNISPFDWLSKKEISPPQTQVFADPVFVNQTRQGICPRFAADFPFLMKP